MKSLESATEALRSVRATLDRTGRAVGLSHKRFDETHELYERSSNQQRLIREWLLELILSRYAASDPLRILSVGCGSGIFDNPLIETIATGTRRVEYTGVDPNPIACRRFQGDFEKRALANVQLDLREHDIESLTATDRFDVIHLVHSLYYFSDPVQTLDRLLRLLGPNGSLVIVVGPEAELNQLAKCFWSQHAEHGVWFSEHLANHLSQCRVAFQRQRIHGAVDVTRCFEPECPRGEMLLDFITQSDCRRLDEDVVKLSRGYLRSISRRENGSLLVAHPADAFVVGRLPATRQRLEST